jgi:hypothetical protein
MPVCAKKSQSGAPLAASYATNLPVPLPWKTRPPAVARVPPFQPIGNAASHRGLRCTGSHAISRPFADARIAFRTASSSGKVDDAGLRPVFQKTPGRR